MSNATTITKTAYGSLAYANGENAHFIMDGRYLSSVVRNSTAIGYWYYDLKTNALVVQYKSSETYYRYEGVPFQVVFDLMLADSLGHFIAKVVKPNYSVA